MRAALTTLLFVAGLLTVGLTLGSAIRVVILPRAIPSRLARKVFLVVRTLFRWRIGKRAAYEVHDRVMAMYGPVSLLALLASWLMLTLFGYMAMYLAVGVTGIRDAFTLSGSSLLTLGFAREASLAPTILSFTEAAIGLVLLALLITYLPSIYGAFQRREQVVALLETRASAGPGETPPSGAVMLERYFFIEGLDALTPAWRRYEQWFAEIEESHTSFPVLAFFRSTQPEQSWVTAAGAILDAAALLCSSVEGGARPEPQLMIRAGYIALRRIATFFRISVPMDPAPTDPISVSRAEYDAVYDRLAHTGLPMKADRERAWQDFAGWRVNYDQALVRLARLTVAPPALWSSDAARIPPEQYGQIKGLFERARRAKS